MFPSLIPSGTFSITPSDSVGFNDIAVGIYAEGAGNIHFIAKDGSEGTRAIAAGGTLVMAVKQVLATGTTATGLHGNKL